MRRSDFDLYRDILKAKSGLTLTPDKSYLLTSRLTPVAKKWGYPTLDAMTLAMRGVPDPNLVKDAVESMMAVDTSFFRDGRPFTLFGNVLLPYLLKSRAAKKTLRVWCAGSSSGQEPYSLAMLMKEKAVPPLGWTAQILATDISTDILDVAQKGQYTQFEVQRGLPIQLLIKYFDKAGESWKIKDEIRKNVKFEPFNLLDDMVKLGMFDVIFCRNVLTYFDEETKKMVLDRLAQRLNPEGGFLFLGAAETVSGLTEAFRPHEKHDGLYVSRGGTYDLEQAVA